MAKKIREQIDYGAYRERMDPSLERKLRDPERNLYGNNPAMGRGSEDVQKLATSRFKKVVDKLKQATGIQDLTVRDIQQILMAELGRAVYAVKPIENRHTEELQNLAIRAALKTTETPEDQYEIIATLTGNQGEIDADNFNFEPADLGNQDNENEPNYGQENPDYGFGADELTQDEMFEIEKHKRNLINGIIQGAAKKGHYIFQHPDVKEELDQIDPTLYGGYLKIMAINDFFYFSMEDLIDAMSQTGQGVEGKEEVESDEDGNIKIQASGFLFPILCHEVIKGIEEGLALHGLPSDLDTSERVRSQTDTLPNESMSLKIGPELLDKIRQFLPDDMFDEENYGVKPYFYMILYRIPATQFLNIIKDVVTDDQRQNDRARAKFNQIFMEAKRLKDRGGENPEDDGEY